MNDMTDAEWRDMMRITASDGCERRKLSKHEFDSTGADESNEPEICASCGLDIGNEIHKAPVGHGETLEQSFDKMRITALKVKRDRDELLEACQSVVNYFWSADFGRPVLTEGEVEELVRGAIKRAGNDAH